MKRYEISELSNDKILSASKFQLCQYMAQLMGHMRKQLKKAHEYLKAGNVQSAYVLLSLYKQHRMTYNALVFFKNNL